MEAIFDTVKVNQIEYRNEDFQRRNSIIERSNKDVKVILSSLFSFENMFERILWSVRILQSEMLLRKEETRNL